jgi:hypothetical protein
VYEVLALALAIYRVVVAMRESVAWAWAGEVVRERPVTGTAV